jgi:hypothetical protein
MFFQPENLGRGEARQDGIAERANRGLQPAELGGDRITFRRGGRITPEFGRTDDCALFVQGNKAMLLAANADGFDFLCRGPGQRQRFANRLGGGIPPGVRMLLFGARWKTRDQIVAFGGSRNDLAVADVTTRTLVDCAPLSMPSKECA